MLMKEKIMFNKYDNIHKSEAINSESIANEYKHFSFSSDAEGVTSNQILPSLY